MSHVVPATRGNGCAVRRSPPHLSPCQRMFVCSDSVHSPFCLPAHSLYRARPPYLVHPVSKAMCVIRRGQSWQRELRRYLYGSTSYGNLRRHDSESLAAVGASCEELLTLVRLWRQLGRLEALEATGVGRQAGREACGNTYVLLAHLGFALGLLHLDSWQVCPGFGMPGREGQRGGHCDTALSFKVGLNAVEMEYGGTLRLRLCKLATAKFVCLFYVCYIRSLF